MPRSRKSFDSLDEMEFYATECHKDFVDNMWKRFGLSEHPGYASLKVVPLFSEEGFFYAEGDRPDTILINRDLATASIEEDDIFDNLFQSAFPVVKWNVFHGSGHFLHPRKRELYSMGGVEFLDLGDNRNVLLSEIVADLGTIEGYHLLEGGDTTINDYFNFGHTRYSDFLARDLFEDGPEDILVQIAGVDFNKAEELIVPHLRRELEICRYPHDIYPKSNDTDLIREGFKHMKGHFLYWS
jgi:hypothetical protein